MSLLLLPACSGKATTDNTDPNKLPGVNTNDVGTPVSGGIYRVAAVADAPSLDPLKESSVATHDAVGLVYSKLVDYKIGPDRAVRHQRSWRATWRPAGSTSADGLTWTFHLRQGVKFQNIDPVNGREFTSADVMCTMDAIKARGQQRGDISMIRPGRRPDKYTVAMKLGRAVPGPRCTSSPATSSGCCRARGRTEKFDLLTQGHRHRARSRSRRG